MEQGAYTWNFKRQARSRQMAPISDLGVEMGKFTGVQSFHLGYARN